MATTTRGGATLCPGLICPGPFGAIHRALKSPNDTVILPIAFQAPANSGSNASSLAG